MDLIKVCLFVLNLFLSFSGYSFKSILPIDTEVKFYNKTNNIHRAVKIGNHKHLEKLLKELPFWDIIA